MASPGPMRLRMSIIPLSQVILRRNASYQGSDKQGPGVLGPPLGPHASRRSRQVPMTRLSPSTVSKGSLPS